MTKMYSKLLLIATLVLIPLSTQTASGLILSDNWAIKVITQGLEDRLEVVEDSISYYESKRAIQLAVMEIMR